MTNATFFEHPGSNFAISRTPWYPRRRTSPWTWPAGNARPNGVNVRERPPFVRSRWRDQAAETHLASGSIGASERGKTTTYAMMIWYMSICQSIFARTQSHKQAGKLKPELLHRRERLSSQHTDTSQGTITAGADKRAEIYYFIFTTKHGRVNLSLITSNVWMPITSTK